MAFDFPSNPVDGQIYVSGNATYVWETYAWKTAASGAAGSPSDYVLKAGDTMTGHLTLNADPLAPLHAATKQYVDVRSLPPVGLAGQALVLNPSIVPQWGAPIAGGNF